MRGQADKFIRTKKPQRALRKTMTDAERKLWGILRGRQFDGCKFRRQHPYEGYILDFVCLEKKLVIEVDGGQHSVEAEYDADRTGHLKKAGFMVLRFWNHEVLVQLDAVKEHIWQVMREAHRTHPCPGPPLEGEGDQLRPPLEGAADNDRQGSLRDIVGLSSGDGSPAARCHDRYLYGKLKERP